MLVVLDLADLQSSFVQAKMRKMHHFRYQEVQDFEIRSYRLKIFTFGLCSRLQCVGVTVCNSGLHIMFAHRLRGGRVGFKNSCRPSCCKKGPLRRKCWLP